MANIGNVRVAMGISACLETFLRTGVSFSRREKTENEDKQRIGLSEYFKKTSFYCALNVDHKNCLQLVGIKAQAHNKLFSSFFNFN